MDRNKIREWLGMGGLYPPKPPQGSLQHIAGTGNIADPLTKGMGYTAPTMKLLKATFIKELARKRNEHTEHVWKLDESR